MSLSCRQSERTGPEAVVPMNAASDEFIRSNERPFSFYTGGEQTPLFIIRCDRTDSSCA